MQIVEPRAAKPSIHFSLRDFVPGERVDRWHETLEQARYVSDFNNIDPDFHGEFTLRTVGGLTVGDFRTSRAQVFRTASNIARCEVQGFMIFQQMGDRGSHFQVGQRDETFLSPGDIVIANPDRPFLNRSLYPFHHRVTVIPRNRLRAGRYVVERLEGGLILRSGDAAARLINAFLRESFDCAADLSITSADGVLDAAASLIAAAAGDDDHDALGLGELALVHRRIRRRLRDPYLTPTRIAGECGMSVRKLHGLFEGSGDTFGSFVRRERLDVARCVLSDPRALNGITDLAAELGFNSLSTFYRIYRETFGEAPGATRAAALARDVPQ
jgi:AraC-like DNA-binding protein